MVENRVRCEARELTEVPDLKEITHYNISSIDLAGNKISNISGRPFLNITLHNQDLFTATNSSLGIPFLELSNNPLHRLDGLEFQGLILPGYFTLKLSNCSLEEVPVVDRAVASKVVDLDLSDNQIIEVSKSGMQQFRRLLSLDLSGNDGLVLHGDALETQRRILQTLYLQRLGLVELPQDLVTGLSRLQLLFLGYNKLRNLPHLLLSNMSCSSLVLYLHQNKLSDIPYDSFRRSAEVPSSTADAFVPCKLARLYLQHNSISTLEFLSDPCSLLLEDYAGIDLSANPLQCDCDLYSIVSRKVIPLLKGECAAPLAGVQIAWNPQSLFHEHGSLTCNQQETFNTYYNCDCDQWLNISLSGGLRQQCPGASRGLSPQAVWHMYLSFSIIGLVTVLAFST